MHFDFTNILIIITGTINLTLLGFLISFFKTFREISQEREQLIKEQKNLSDAKTQVVEKELAYTDRQNKQLLQEKEHLEKQISESLKAEGFDINYLLNNSTLREFTAGFTEKIELLTKKLEDVQNKNHLETSDGKYHYVLGSSFIMNRDWEKAAYHLDMAVISFPEDWQIHVSRGVSYSNMRGNKKANIKAIEAYTQAIIYAPEDEKEFLNKIHIYRGAIYKRINLLKEALLDIEYGLANTTDADIIADGNYNLACIFAMQNEREKLLVLLKKLKNQKVFMKGIQYHLNDYFINFKNDKEFLELLIEGRVSLNL